MVAKEACAGLHSERAIFCRTREIFCRTPNNPHTIMLYVIVCICTRPFTWSCSLWPEPPLMNPRLNEIMYQVFTRQHRNLEHFGIQPKKTPLSLTSDHYYFWLTAGSVFTLSHYSHACSKMSVPRSVSPCDQRYRFTACNIWTTLFICGTVITDLTINQNSFV